MEESSDSANDILSNKNSKKNFFVCKPMNPQKPAIESKKGKKKFSQIKNLNNIKSRKNENFVEKINTSFKSASEKKSNTYSDTYNIITKELKYIKKIDEGAYGEVKLAKYQGNEVALKYFKKNGKAQEQLIEEFTKEIKALDKLRHPNILFYMGYFYEKNNFVMVSQFASKGSLYNLLHKKKNKLSEDNIIIIIKQIVKAMIYTHSKIIPQFN